ncbi:hypothetical protein KUTeg_006568 [Tegillarca granosa]|uniref:Uncharacterized protein n=1 Tax=Tegillarca granosa TaxID=220873 RepID=A0ABQ9FEX5_TEGGR|nr:hypothetical protein KUTeg_006568 [Tegillarca granosa]
MLSPSETEYLDKIWTDPKHPAAFAEKLYQIKDRQNLSDRDAYSLQKRVERKLKKKSLNSARHRHAIGCRFDGCSKINTFKNRQRGEFDNNIRRCSSYHYANETNSNFAEKTIQNMKNRIYRKFIETKSYKYIKE